MNCETCFWRDIICDGVFCVWYGESMTENVEDCKHYIPLEDDDE